MPSPALEILLIEDDPRDAQMIRQQAAEISDPAAVIDLETTLAGGLARLSSKMPAAVLVDLTLSDGRGVLAVTRIHEKFPAVPIVALNVLENETLAVDTIREGAQDYLVKETLTAGQLKKSILFAIERKHVERELARLASFAWQNPNAVLECDREGRILYLNPAGQTLFPELRNAVSQHVFLEGMAEVFIELSKEQKPSKVRELKTGERFYEQHLSLVPERQTIRSYIADITERKQAEAALRERTVEVERMNRVMIGRELRMAELKKQIAALKKEPRRAA